MNNIKPLGRKNYGSIGHLPNSRLGPKDKHIHQGQAEIATLKTRDENDLVIVQEKLDGSNVGVCKVNGDIIPIVRAGYSALSSPYKMHHVFHDWVMGNEGRFIDILEEGERICGEWMYQAHGTIYKLNHDPFVAFDVFSAKNERLLYEDFLALVDHLHATPKLIHAGGALPVEKALTILGDYGFHGAKEKCEGLVYRVERNGVVDFLCKYVRKGKRDGKYLNDEVVLNEM